MRDRLNTFEYELLDDKQKLQVANRESRNIDIANSFGQGLKANSKSLHRKVKSMQGSIHSQHSAPNKEILSNKTLSQISSTKHF